jgi:hypothetical protein
MRTILFGTVAAVGIGMAAMTSLPAAPVSGGVIGVAADSGLTESIHCKRYPHRHRAGIPHGFGFGCAKRPPTKPKRES